MQQIALSLNCSVNRVVYWMNKYQIKRRKIKDAIYQWHNPDGDPFKFTPPRNIKEAELFGMGVGLFWGEGNKASSSSVRLGNTDPELIKAFIVFLITFFGIKKDDLKFSLQIFTDINEMEALDFWAKSLKIKKSQFGKVVVTISGSIGTYRRKSKYGVLTVQYHNVKLRNLLHSFLPM